jgi:glycosyltransferase involved in cell wall biosynthesis
MSNPLLSIVVIGRNEGTRLVRCLESIRAGQRQADLAELVYVDSRSTDGSPQRAAASGAKVVVLEGGRLSAARARNAGWRAASAPLIFFLDGDTILDPSFIDRALAEFADPRVVVICGNRREIHPEASVYQRVLDLEWISRPGLADFCGGDAIIRRSALEQANGYDPDLIAGEEPDLCRRLRAAGGLVMHIDAPMVQHDLAITRWIQYWRHAVRAGYAYAEVSSRYKSSSDPLWTRESRRNLRRGPLVFFGPLVAAGAAVLSRSWETALVAALLAGMVLWRTAWLARWRSASRASLILFSVHSHVQQVPIFCGQMSYYWGRLRNKKRELIEYKPGVL